jgi:peroxiredoxin family protein
MAADIAQTDTSAAATNASIYANTAKSIGNQSNVMGMFMGGG